MAISIDDVLDELNAIRTLSASRRLRCDCIQVPIKDGHGERMTCPETCPHSELDLHVANALVFAEILKEGKG